jgi:Uma2 family endonuclease
MGMPLRVPTYTTDDVRAFPRDGQRYELVQGTLLVTPAPSNLHQVVITRLFEALRRYLPEASPAWVVSPGEIEVNPHILMDPDILVYPASFAIGTAWTAISDWWLAVEVYGPSSRVYDHDFKRPAYLALGVREVWMVDPDKRSISISRMGAVELIIRDELSWHPPGQSEPFRLDLARLFSGMA